MKSLTPRIRRLAISLVAASAVAEIQAVAVHFGSFISAPTFFNGFESIRTDQYSATGYAEGGISVSYVGTLTPQHRFVGPALEAAGIWSTWTNNIGGEGTYGWYGPGEGYTSIKLANGDDMEAIQFLAGSGWGYAVPFMQYELLHDNVVVAGGTIQIDNGNWSTAGWARGFPSDSADPLMSTFGFSGGAFDEVRLQNRGSPQLSFQAGAFEAAALDSIAITTRHVPDKLGMASACIVVLAGLTLFRRTALIPALASSHRPN